MQEILTKDVWEFLKTKNNCFLIDIRTEHEWSSEGFPDLTSIDKKLIKITWHNDEETFIDLLKQSVQDKSSHIFFLCRSGVRSATAVTIAMFNEYKNCYNVIDGFKGWKNNNLPYVKK